MTCQELMLVIDAFVDDELSVMENLRVQAHLVFCHACRGTVESEVRLRGLIEADARAEVTPPHLRDRILRLADEQAPPGPSPGGRRAPRTRRIAPGASATGTR